jgi:hypothetical protein
MKGKQGSGMNLLDESFSYCYLLCDSEFIVAGSGAIVSLSSYTACCCTCLWTMNGGVAAVIIQGQLI